MKVLAENGADIFCVNKLGNSVLHLAAKKNYLNIVKMLIVSKFPLNEINGKGYTACAIAA